MHNNLVALYAIGIESGDVGTMSAPVCFAMLAVKL